jgi:hypothetical protein
MSIAASIWLGSTSRCVTARIAPPTALKRTPLSCAFLANSGGV